MDETRGKILESLDRPLPVPRERLFIQLVSGPSLGGVSRCRYNEPDGSIMVGINICESSYWNRGLGTEAPHLRIDYLFGNMDLDRIGMRTWAGNLRMVRVAEKCGFRLEERIPKNIEATRNTLRQSHLRPIQTRLGKDKPNALAQT